VTSLTGRRLTNDVELMAVVLFWAFNITVVKVSLREMGPLAFNVLRFSGAAILLVILTRWIEGSVRVERKDMGRMILLGLVGHTLYQLCFILGLEQTTASATALIFGSTPIVIGLMSRVAGHEKIALGSAAGALLAFTGVYLIGHGGAQAGPDDGVAGSVVVGNALVMAAVVWWSLYTVLSKRLLERYSPLRVTAVSLSIGTLFMIPAAIPDLAAQRWDAVSARTWIGLVYSLVFALVVSYVIWYRSVKEVGSLRTAVYSNMVPVFGALSGFFLLGERVTAGLGIGGACILGGIVLTRLQGNGEPRRP
jgi:drug/metabolite transporter (DMT)-like permease